MIFRKMIMRNTILWLLGASAVLADYPRMPRSVGGPGNGTAIFNASSSAVPSILASTKTTPSAVTLVSVTTDSTSHTAASNTVVPSHTSSEYQFPSDRLGPIATLQPSLPEYHNVYDVEHLSPHEKGTGAPLHYVQPSSESECAQSICFRQSNWDFNRRPCVINRFWWDIRCRSSQVVVPVCGSRPLRPHRRREYEP